MAAPISGSGKCIYSPDLITQGGERLSAHYLCSPLECGAFCILYGVALRQNPSQISPCHYCAV
jgi:hypothetical protein